MYRGRADCCGVVARPLPPNPLRFLVVHHLPRCVSVGKWSIGLLSSRSPASHPFFPSRATPGRCVLAAAAACALAGVVSASAQPSCWYTRVVLIAAGLVLRFLLPTPLRTQVVHPMLRRVSVCMQPNTSTPPSGVLVVCCGSRECMARSLTVAGGVCFADGVRSFVGDVGGVCTCVVSWAVLPTLQCPIDVSVNIFSHVFSNSVDGNVGLWPMHGMSPVALGYRRKPLLPLGYPFPRPIPNPTQTT